MVDAARFERWLRQGRGRAALAIDEYGDRPFREALVWAIRHDLRYEALADDRVWFLRHLIARTRDPGFYRHIVLASLRAARSRDDLDQVVALATAFAREGDEEAARAARDAVESLLYRRFNAYGIGDWLAWTGIEGFQLGLRLLAERTPTDLACELDGLLSRLEDSVREEALAAARRVPVLTPFVEEIERPREPTCGYVSPAQWAVKATEEELAAAATELNSQPERQRLRYLLRVFGERRFPSGPGVLVAMCESGVPRFPGLAAKALGLFRDGRVRALALRLLRSRERAANGIQILAGNYEPGDWRLVAKALGKRMTPAEREHALFPVPALYEKHPHPDAIPLLIAGYREDPCEIHRSRLVRPLLAAGEVPPWMLEELPHDSDSETRAMVASPP